MGQRKKKTSLITLKGMNDIKRHPASFRDPSGYIFTYKEKIYRQVNQVYADNLALLHSSGLYDLLAKQKKILTHTELAENLTGDLQWHKTLLPEQLDFISYPYEWCFSQWKDAALLTLNLVKTSIAHGMILKDATPFNIQFVQGAPVLIDSLSFEKYDASKPWIAYRQFIECFIGPLLLAKYNTPDLLRIFQLYPQGLPLPVVISMLPFKSRLSFNMLLHIYLPAAVSGNKKNTLKKDAGFTKQKLLNIINSLQSFVQSIKLPASRTSWNNYYEETVLSDEYVKEKMIIVKDWVINETVNTVLDLGANTGLFAEMTAAAGKFTIAVDADIACIDKLYNTCRQKKITNLLPLYADISNPAPAVGWDNKERTSFNVRAHADITLALALIHHLAIGKNISFEQVAELFSSYSPFLIIEFVPKNDPKVQLLLQEREDIFGNYNEASFLEAFEKKFTVLKKSVVPGTERVIFLMKSN